MKPFYYTSNPIDEGIFNYRRDSISFLIYKYPFADSFAAPFFFFFFSFFFFTADVEKENHRPPRIKIMAHLAVTFAILFEPMRLALSYQSMGNNVRRAMLLIWIYPVRVKTCNIRLIKNIGQRRKVIAANIKLSERSS